MLANRAAVRVDGRPVAAGDRAGELEFVLVDSIEQVFEVAFDGTGNGATRRAPAIVKQAAKTR